MKKIVFLMMLLLTTTAITAQVVSMPAGSNNATLLHLNFLTAVSSPSDGDQVMTNQVMTNKQCIDFLSTRNKPAYETFLSGYKCLQSSWGLFGAGLGLDLVGSILLAFVPEEGNPALSIPGDICVITGSLAVLASIPMYFIGYSRRNKGIDMFNMDQAAATQAYWTIQGSQNGVGLALHF